MMSLAGWKESSNPVLVAGQFQQCPEACLVVYAAEDVRRGSREPPVEPPVSNELRMLGSMSCATSDSGFPALQLVNPRLFSREVDAFASWHCVPTF